MPNFWRYVSDSVYDIAVMTRNTSMMCSDNIDYDNPVLGDQLSINNQFSIPLTMSDAESNGWVMGNCISKMGIHHAYDLLQPGGQTWNSSSLVPVLPMYSPETGGVNAVLFAFPHLEMIEIFGEWEGPFTPGLFCKNWCANSGCMWPDVTVWTTMHWMFHDPSLNNCNGAKCSL